MPGGNAAMPGLVLTSLSGKTIRVDNTWHDGRIFLVDALSYAERYKPCLTMNVATLDGIYLYSGFFCINKMYFLMPKLDILK